MSRNPKRDCEILRTDLFAARGRDGAAETARPRRARTVSRPELTFSQYCVAVFRVVVAGRYLCVDSTDPFRFRNQILAEVGLYFLGAQMPVAARRSAVKQLCVSPPSDATAAWAVFRVVVAGAVPCRFAIQLTLSQYYV